MVKWMKRMAKMMIEVGKDKYGEDGRMAPWMRWI